MRVSELSNPHTADIDKVSLSEMIARIGLADAEMFGSAQWGAGLLNPHLIEQLEALRAKIFQALQHPNGRVVLGGAGTSGRLAMHAAAVYGPNLGPGQLLGQLAGGPDAFFKAKERVEDMPSAGIKDLQGALPQDGPLVYIGITCGLSAAYVAGALHCAMGREQSYSAILGFNPQKDASQRPLPGLDCSFLHLLERLSSENKGALLSPIIGPEPISGSTRMKGGTATRIILACLLSPLEISEMLMRFQQLQKAFYSRPDHLLPAVERAAQALNRGQSIAYLAGPREGLMAMLDASECPPTFGSDINQVRAFVDEGFSVFLPEFNMDGFHISRFRREMAFAVFLMGSPNLKGLEEEVVNGYRLEPSGEVRTVMRDLPAEMREAAGDLVLKWTLNLISTCAFIQWGKVYGNKMIDLKISNVKLWERAARIVGELGVVSEDLAKENLLQAMGLDKDDPLLDLSQVISTAVKRQKLVSTAILMARKGISATHAKTLLEATPKLSDCLSS